MQSILFLLNSGGFFVCVTLHYRITRNLAISWRVYFSQGLVYIPIQIQTFCLHVFSPDISIRVNVLISLTEKCWMVGNGAMNITGWTTELCSIWCSQKALNALFRGGCVLLLLLQNMEPGSQEVRLSIRICESIVHSLGTLCWRGGKSL